MQNSEHPAGIEMAVDRIDLPNQNPIQYFVECLKHGRTIEGPLSPEMSRIGQQIVDTAYESASLKKTLRLKG
jgi:glucose-fructose oxidoreductase